MTFKDLEKLRESYKAKLIRTTAIAFIPTFLIFGLFLVQSSSLFFIIFALIFCGLFSFGIAGFFTRKEAAAYQTAYKTYFVESTLHQTFTDIKYNHAEGFSRQYIREAGLLSTGDRFSSNDLTIGKYKNIQF